MTLRTVTFADLEAGVWGVIWDGSPRLGAVGTPAGTTPLGSPTLNGTGEEWVLRSESGPELTITPEGPAADTEDGFEQLCRVRGNEIDCPGRRSLRGEELRLSELDSVRDFSAWFAPGDGVVLRALRPRKAKGHDADEVTATVFEEGEVLRVADPRLSTTYTPNGDPRRISLELWLDDEEAQFPRRVAGAATGAQWRGAAGGLELQAELMRCQRREVEGAGVYLLARPR